MRIFLTCFGFFLLFTFSSCEDDPILEAAPKSSSGGSYGKISVATGDPARKDSLIIHNPETF